MTFTTKPVSLDSLHTLAEPWQSALADLASACSAARRPFDLRTLLLCMRDMPYKRPEGGQSAVAAIKEWRGTCSTKHMAVFHILTALGFSPQLMMACFEIPNSFPCSDPELRQTIAASTVFDVHNFILCDLGWGDLIIDVTFPKELQSKGFTVTEHWDGVRSFKLACEPQEIRQVYLQNVLEDKRAWLESLNSRTARLIRERVIADMQITMAQLPAFETRSEAMAATIKTME